MKKVKLFFTTLVALMIATVAFAQQNVRVSGTVTDAATGEAVPGATIQLVGSATNYALSDALGNFSISVPRDGVLEISCLGFVSVEVAVAGRSVVNVALESDAQQLEVACTVSAVLVDLLGDIGGRRKRKEFRERVLLHGIAYL